MTAESTPARGAMALGRVIVFVLGTVWGVLAAMILTSYPVNGPAAVWHFAIWSTHSWVWPDPSAGTSQRTLRPVTAGRWPTSWPGLDGSCWAASRKRSLEVRPRGRVGRPRAAHRRGWTPNRGNLKVRFPLGANRLGRPAVSRCRSGRCSSLAQLPWRAKAVTWHDRRTVGSKPGHR